VISWSEAAPGLKALIEKLAVDRKSNTPIKARWAGRSNGFISPTLQKELILRVRAESSTGDDEQRLDTISSVRREVLVGQRKILLEVRAESLRHREEEGNWAWSMLGLIRTRMERQSSVDALTTLNMVLIDISQARDISYTSQDRETNAAMMELTIIGAFSDVNIDDAIDVFDRALVTSHLQRTDGTELSTPINYTDEPMGKP